MHNIIKFTAPDEVESYVTNNRQGRQELTQQISQAAKFIDAEEAQREIVWIIQNRRNWPAGKFTPLLVADLSDAIHSPHFAARRV